MYLVIFLFNLPSLSLFKLDCTVQEARGHIWFSIVPAIVTNANYGMSQLCTAPKVEVA